MEISSNVSSLNINNSSNNIKTNFTEKISKDEAEEIKAQISENARSMMVGSTTTQASVSNQQELTNEDFKSFLNDIGYDGKPIAELSQDEAADLVSEDGFFGIDQTSQRIADFVINGANGDESMMRAGRDGMIQGFKEAEDMWGGELPEISQKTMDKALELVDKAMYDLGYSVLDTEA
jgi:hypothetical protein